MAIFSGKILEAYFTNTDNTSIEVIYQDGKKAISHYMAKDMSHPDFKDLIMEYPIVKIEETTIQKNKAVLNQLNRAVENRIKNRSVDRVDYVKCVHDCVINYKSKDHADFLFDLKLDIFELPLVKNHSDMVMKQKIRLATSPLEVLSVYSDLVKSSK